MKANEHILFLTTAEGWLCAEAHPRVQGPRPSGMGLGQGYVSLVYPEQFAFLSVETAQWRAGRLHA